MSSANNNSFTSFPIWIPFISFSSLIAMARIPKTMFNKSGKSGYHCFFPDLSRSAFSFSLLKMMLAVGLSIFFFFYVEVGSLYAYFLEGFFLKIINGCWVFSKASSASAQWSYGFYSLICECGVCVTLIDSWVIEESLCPWNKSNLIVIYDPFNELLDSVC